MRATPPWKEFHEKTKMGTFEFSPPSSVHASTTVSSRKASSKGHCKNIASAFGEQPSEFHRNERYISNLIKICDLQHTGHLLKKCARFLMYSKNVHFV
jgi:hypothetical protein